MFGISWTEFLVILLVAVCVVPVKNWPDVARFFAKVFKYIRNIVWKLSDFSEQVQHRLDLEKPIDDLINDAGKEIFERKTKSKPVKKSVKKK
jgi:Sec-independent protein translocase protein TatA